MQRTLHRPRRVLAAAGMSLVALTTALHAQGPLADYGDAPDPPYPSRFASVGVHHLDTSQEWFGPAGTSTTTRENDSIQAGDADDGGGAFFTLPPVGTVFAITVSYDPALSPRAAMRLLNVLVDLDGDGTWEGGTEWPVRNVVVDFTPLPAAVTSLRVAVLLPPSLTAVAVTGKQVRATLSTAPLANGSGAWGALARGETEDFVAFVVPLTPSKIAGIKTLFPVFTPTRPRVRHGFVHAEDGPNPDATLVVSYPPFVVGTAATLKLRWRRVADHTGNPYRGVLGGAAGVALPAAIGPYSPTFVKAYPAPPGAPLFDTFPIDGAFATNAIPGDTDVEFKAKVFYDPEGEWVMFTNDNDESVVPPPPGDPNNATLGGYFTIGPCDDLLHDNGPIITHPRQGTGGADVSALDNTSTHHAPHTIYGFGAQWAAGAGNSLADDFTVSDTWSITHVEVFGYQTNAAVPNATGVYCRVWNGDPRSGGVVVRGDLTTNLLTTPPAGTFHCYRTPIGSLTATSRQVQTVRVPVTWAPLTPGVYWFEFQLTGASYCPPVTENTVNDTGNAIQRQSSTWIVLNNAAAPNTAGCAVPFRVYGTALNETRAWAATYGAGKEGSRGFGAWDPGSPPQRPVLGRDYPLRLVDGRAGSVPIVAVGTQMAAGLPFAPVGRIYVLPIAVTLAMPSFDSQGVSALRLPIPHEPALSGASLAWQGLWVDPGAAGSIGHSNGLLLTLGN